MFRPQDEEELWSLVTEERWAGYQQGGKSIRCCNNSCSFSVFHCQRASFWSVMRSRLCMFAASARSWKLKELKNVKIYHSSLFGGPTAAKKVRSAATLLLFCFWNPDPAVFLSVDPDPDLAFFCFYFIIYIPVVSFWIRTQEGKWMRIRIHSPAFCL